MTRAGVARVVDVSKPTIADVFAELVDDGIVRQIGYAQGRRGPRAALYDLHHEVAWIVGLDVGRRWLRASLADLSGRIVARCDEPTDTTSNAALVAQIGRLAHELADSNAVPWDAVAQTTIGSPGVVDTARNAVLLAPNLPGWDRDGLLSSVRDLLGERVDLENDVNLAALAELREGHGRGRRDFVYLWVGTGVGLGLILDGRLHRGAHGMAGEAAYLPVPWQTSEEGEARRRGRFEAAAAGDAVVRLAAEAGLDAPSAQAVFELARQGDARAQAVVDEEARLLTLGLAAIVPVIDPELIILGGGVGHNGDVLIEPIRQGLAGSTPFTPEIVTAALGTDAVVQGAVGLAVSSAWDHVLAGEVRPA